MSPTTRRRFLQAAGASAALAACGPTGAARRADKPNVLVIIVDTLRADHVYGNRARTPNMDELIRAGLSFTRAYPEAMPTVPARNSILAGRRMFPFRNWHDYPSLLDSPGWAPPTHLDSNLTSVLRRAGWWTGYVTDNPFLGYSSAYERFRRGFDLFEAKGGQLGRVRPPSSVSDRALRQWVHPTLRKSPAIRLRVRKYMANSRYWTDDARSFAARVFREGASVLDTAAKRRPFALVVDTYEPHEPWTPPRRFVDLYGDPDYHGAEPSMPRYMRTRRWLNERQKRTVLPRLHALYAAEVTMTDRWLGAFLERLYELGLERETVIVLVSDHGILLGEHGWTGKISVALYPSLTRVPLVIVDPQRRGAGARRRYFASTHDIAPTILSMVGVPAPPSMTGNDLSAFLRGGKAPARPFAYGGYANSFYLRSDRWVLFGENRPAGLKLFDLERDRGENRNLARRRPQLARELHEQVVERAGGRLPYYRNT
jgi:arylsulfatase A-like enzyme